MESARIYLSELEVGAIVNTSSGGCDAESGAEILALLKSLNVSNCKTRCGESDQIERAFAEAATQELKVLLVLGGDVTIRTAAEACTRDQHLCSPAARRDAEHASSGAVWRHTVARHAQKYTRFSQIVSDRLKRISPTRCVFPPKRPQTPLNGRRHCTGKRLEEDVVERQIYVFEEYRVDLGSLPSGGSNIREADALQLLIQRVDAWVLVFRLLG
jgi:hypothetical protein